MRGDALAGLEAELARTVTSARASKSIFNCTLFRHVSKSIFILRHLLEWITATFIIDQFSVINQLQIK
jgi:hypothetical protein